MCLVKSNTFEKVTNGWLDENEVCVKKTLRTRHLIYLMSHRTQVHITVMIYRL